MIFKSPSWHSQFQNDDCMPHSTNVTCVTVPRSCMPHSTNIMSVSQYQGHVCLTVPRSSLPHSTNIMSVSQYQGHVCLTIPRSCLPHHTKVISASQYQGHVFAIVLKCLHPKYQDDVCFLDDDTHGCLYIPAPGYICLLPYSEITFTATCVTFLN